MCIQIEDIITAMYNKISVDPSFPKHFLPSKLSMEVMDLAMCGESWQVSIENIYIAFPFSFPKFLLERALGFSQVELLFLSYMLL